MGALEHVPPPRSQLQLPQSWRARVSAQAPPTKIRSILSAARHEGAAKAHSRNSPSCSRRSRPPAVLAVDVLGQRFGDLRRIGARADERMAPCGLGKPSQVTEDRGCSNGLRPGLDVRIDWAHLPERRLKPKRGAEQVLESYAPAQRSKPELQSCGKGCENVLGALWADPCRESEAGSAQPFKTP